MLAYRLEDTLAETRAAVEAVNRERKVVQLQGQREMADYESRWAETVAKNREIDAACRELEGEIASLRAQLPAQYVPSWPCSLVELSVVKTTDIWFKSTCTIMQSAE